MPNAAATFDDDFGYDAPARKVAARRPRSTGAGKKKRRKGRRFPIDMHKVARYAAIGMGATLAVGIMVNALMMQKGHHPAPLFGNAITLAVAPPKPAASTLARAPTPAPDPAASVAEPAAAPSVLAAKVRHPSSDDAPKGDDAIGRLLQRTGDIQNADHTDPKTVLGVQRALAKLGFALKPNGTFGPATRKAIESFEKDRHLPVKGTLTPRLVKIIGAESGVKID